MFRVIAGKTKRWWPLCALMLFCVGVRAALGVGVWTPSTGEVELEELERDSAEARFRHAAALVGAGQYKSGLAQLRELLAEEPADGLQEQIRYVVVLALVGLGKPKVAFEEAGQYLESYPDGELAGEVQFLQLEAARAAMTKDPSTGRSLYDILIKDAAADEEAAFYMKEKADALLGKGLYLEAMDGYLSVVDFYPASEWFPYCWYKVGECKLKQAMWLRLGSEHLWDAMRELAGFTQTYPSHQYADDARRDLERARSMAAELEKEIALYYLRARKRYAAAASCLARIIEDYRGTEQARWAAETLREVAETTRTPLPGRLRAVSVPGVVPRTGEPRQE